jgi:hypothetical protein
MRSSLVRCTMPGFMLVGAIVALGGPDLLACSGPGAAKTIRESERIGSSFAGISIAIVSAGCVVARRALRGGESPGSWRRWCSILGGGWTQSKVTAAMDSDLGPLSPRFGSQWPRPW